MLQFSQLIFVLFFLHLVGVHSAKFTLINKCSYTVWPATLTGAGTTPLPAAASGFSLFPAATSTITVPPSWSGRVWARTLCTTGPTGNFSCATGDCATGSVQCSGSGSGPPATLAEFTLDGSGGLDFYDVSLVDGYNLPLLVRPVGGSGNCSAAGCITDLNGSCPARLRVMTSASGANGDGVACRSACDAFGDPKYCCSGAYATPDTCKPSSYSKYFKAACPSAYSYAYDDASSTFTCAGADYVITFCPTAAATDKSTGSRPGPGPGPGPEPQATEIENGTLSPDSLIIPPYNPYSSASLIPLFSSTIIIGLIIWSSSIIYPL